VIVPMIDQALAQARMLIGADPQQGGVRPPERAKYEDRGRSFARVPAREWRRLLSEALPRVGLVLVTESETLTGGDLTVTFSLTHVGCGDTRTLTRVEPLPPAKSRSMGKQWAHTRAVNAVARTLLWQWDDEDEAADDAEDDAEKVQREDRAPRPRGQRPTKATRATNTLAGVLTGQVGAPAIELGQAEQEQEEQRAAEAERQAEERMAEQPAAPVADPDWLDETLTNRADLEERLRSEAEQNTAKDGDGETPPDGPAGGAVLPAAPSTDDPAPPSPTSDSPGVESSTVAGSLSAAAPSTPPPASPPSTEVTGGSSESAPPVPAAATLTTDAPPAPGPVPPGEAGEASSPTPEETSDSPGQGASTDGPCDAFDPQGNTGRSSWWCARCDYHEEDHAKPPTPEEPTSDRPSGEPALCGANGCSERAAHPWTLCPAHATAVGLLAPEGPGERDDMCWACGGEGRDPMTGALCVTCGATGEVQVPDWRCATCGETCVDTEGEVCGLCVTTEGRCAECDLPLAADSEACPDPDCLSHLPTVPLTEPTPSQVNVVGNVAARVGASEDSGPAPDPLAEFSGRRAMTAKENARPVKCALCGEDVEPLAKYYAGSSRSRRAHVGCVTAGEQGRKPRKVGAARELLLRALTVLPGDCRLETDIRAWLRGAQ